MLIPNWLFEEKHRKTIYIRIPFCQSNEHYALKFIRKLESSTKEKYSVVYEGKCNCGKNYIGETGRNVTKRWDEHSDISKNSEPAKHLNQFSEDIFNWKILRRVSKIVRQRKIHEAYYVMWMHPTLKGYLRCNMVTSQNVLSET